MLFNAKPGQLLNEVLTAGAWEQDFATLNKVRHQRQPGTFILAFNFRALNDVSISEMGSLLA